MVAGPRGPTIAPLWHARGECGAAISLSAVGRYHWSQGVTLELQAVHNITDGGPTGCPEHHDIACNPVADPMSVRHMGGRPAPNNGRGDLTGLWAVPHGRAKGKLGGEPDAEVHKTSPARKSLGRVSLASLLGERRIIPNPGQLHQDGGSLCWMCFYQIIWKRIKRWQKVWIYIKYHLLNFSPWKSRLVLLRRRYCRSLEGLD